MTILAHLVTTGLGPIYDGIGHLVLSLDDLVPVIGLALLAGLRGPAGGRWALFLLPIVWFVAGVIGLYVPHDQLTFPYQCISFLLLGILVASDAPIPAFMVAGLAIIMGCVHGYLNGIAIRSVGIGAGTLELIGIMVSLFVLIALFSSLVITLRWPAARIVVRVAGSWIAAFGLLLLGWAFRRGPI